MPYVTYLRVSTQRQGLSGLGLQAQEEAVRRHAKSVGELILKTFVEVESGAAKDRPQLTAALAFCRQNRATLLIARLDRLSRSLSFIAQLLESNVEITAADAPSANRMMLQMLAVFAEHERGLISARTIAALAAAKARGIKLGRNGAVLARVRRTAADEFAASLKAEVEEGARLGHKSARALAAWLNEKGLCNRAGSAWSGGAAARLSSRLRVMSEGANSDSALCALGPHEPSRRPNQDPLDLTRPLSRLVA